MLNEMALSEVKTAIAWCETAKKAERPIDYIFGLVWTEGKTMPAYSPEIEESVPSLVRNLEGLITAEIEVNILCPATSVTDEESWDYLIGRLKLYLL